MTWWPAPTCWPSLPGVAHDLDANFSLVGDLELTDAPEFGAWLEARRAERSAAERVHLRTQIEALTAAGDHRQALTLAEQLIQRDPSGETGYRLLMQAHYLAGDRAAARATYERCARMLERDIGVQPSAATLALRATIEQASTDAPHPVHTAVPASVLRPPRLVGRARELARLTHAWDAGQIALVCGEAGMGKSRLLQALVERHAGLV